MTSGGSPIISIARLITSIASGTTPPARSDTIRIMQHMVISPWNPKATLVDPLLVQAGLPMKLPSLTAHHLKRTRVSKDWDSSVTIAEYESDVRDAIVHSSARHVVFGTPPQLFIGALSTNVVPPSRLGVDTKDLVFVVYSVQTGVLLSGYQIENPALLSLGVNPRWLP